MIIVDSIKLNKNPVEVNEQFTVEITLHEEYENAKKYANKYPYRYRKEE